MHRVPKRWLAVAIPLVVASTAVVAVNQPPTASAATTVIIEAATTALPTPPTTPPVSPCPTGLGVLTTCPPKPPTQTPTPTPTWPSLPPGCGGDLGVLTTCSPRPPTTPPATPSIPPCPSGPGALTTCPPKPPTTPPAAGCTATFRVITSWPQGFQAETTVANVGASAINGWRVTWTPPAGQNISQVWNGVLSTGGGSVTVTNASYNGSISPQGRTTFGMIISGSPGSAPALTCTSA